MFWDWFWEYGIVILFYVGVVALIYFNRSKFHFENKIIAMYRTKIGLKLMDSIGGKHPRLIQFLGILGIYFGFLGMLFMVLFMGLGLYLMVFRPDLPALFAPVLPGIQIPGSPVKLPLIEGLIALFVVVVIHEFSHGVVSRAYNFKIKSSGFVMMGPLPGAFVEPDEKQLKKAPKKAQLSVFAAGPFSNILLFGVILGIYILGLAGASGIYEPTGIVIAGFVNESDSLYGARLSELSIGEIITKIDEYDVKSIYDVRDALSEKNPGDEVDLIQDNGSLTKITLTSDPNNSSIPYLGLMLDSRVEPKDGLNKAFFSFIKTPLFWIFNVLYWIWVLSLGIGIVNLLPLGL